jgi:hypothetical protein
MAKMRWAAFIAVIVLVLGLIYAGCSSSSDRKVVGVACVDAYQSEEQKKVQDLRLNESFSPYGGYNSGNQDERSDEIYGILVNVWSDGSLSMVGVPSKQASWEEFMEFSPRCKQ